ncbi:stalk domain-containing protein [Tissierella sp.]|uniref:copper amine oxidase N-terminal domain-containing protein n=1 Tax=Tissierella sp. TaxID=41274 RepID=UPI0030661513
MKKLKPILSIVVLSALIAATPVFGQANNGKNNSNNGKQPVKEEKVKEGKVKEEKVKEEKEKNNNGNNGDNNKANPGKGQDKSWKEAKDLVEAEKDALEVKKDELETEKDELEKQLEEAETNGNKELAEQLKTQISEIEKQRLEIKSEMKNTINLMKEVVKNRYNIEELEELRKISDELKEQNEDIIVIPVENISTNKDIKFDTPPVIKEGRTLIPVRALTQGFGAEVEWKSEEKKVTITKGDKEIVLYLDNKTATVNGEKVELEVPSTAYNNRTYVPLRFIIENLGLKIDYDEDTGLIEIDDEDDKDIDNKDNDDDVDNVEDGDDGKNNVEDTENAEDIKEDDSQE